MGYVGPMIAVLAATLVTPVGDVPQLKIRVEMAKQIFLAGEPIGIKVRIRSSPGRPIEVANDYPTFQLPGSLNISFSGKGERLRARKLIKRYDGGMSADDASVEPGLDFEIYLQRYFEALAPGAHLLSYRLRVPCTVNPGHGHAYESTVSTAGDLAFTVKPSSAEQRDKAFGDYWRKLRQPRWWDRQMAVEALSVVDDPQVVRYLARMVQGYPTEALAALAKFPKNKGAQIAVISALDVKGFSTVEQALRILMRWKYELPKERVKRLLKRDNERIRKALAEYIEVTRQDAYLELLKP